MCKKAIIGICCVALTVGLMSAVAMADSDTTDVQTQINEMREKLEDLEKKLEESRKAQAANAPTVTAASKGAKMKIDGRIFVGTFASGAQGTYPNWSTDIPDAKLRFTFLPSKDITVVSRFAISTSKPVEVDYLYADFDRIIGAHNTLRLGQRKIDVGQETWVDNPVENMLISNSISHVSGYGIGLATRGRFKGPDSPLYELGYVNGPKGVTARPSTGVPINAKIGAPFAKNLFASASYFNTGTLGGGDLSAISVAEVNSAPTGATKWQRSLWELDLRYNYGASGIRPLIPIGTLPPLMLGATYGRFFDDATSVPDRTGSYWFAEGMARLSDKAYAAVRYSVTELGDSATAKLGKSPVAVNSYKRTSVGLGYALSDLVQLKMEYSINSTAGATPDPSLNQWSVGAAAKF